MAKHVASVLGTGARARAVIVGVCVALVAVAGWYVFRPGGIGRAASGACPTTVTVVTASSFAPVLAAAGRGLRDKHSGDDGGADCVQVNVKLSEGRSAAADVVSSGADAWIPDDSAWTATIDPSTLAPTGNGGSGRVLATSPIFMVTDAATADRVRAAGSSWLGLSGLLTGGAKGIQPGCRPDHPPQAGTLCLVIRDPSGSGDGMVAAGAVGEAVWLDKGMDASSLALADAEKVTRTVTHELAATPSLPGDVGLVPEYALLPSIAVPGVNRVSLSPVDRTAMLRYTWLPTAAALANPRRSAALKRLLDRFSAPDVRTATGAAGLRTPDGARPPTPGADKLPAVTAAPFDVLAPHHVQHIFATWDPEDRRSNVLIVVDVSAGAAGKPGPDLDLLKRGCRQLADLLPDGSHLGLWEVGGRPYTTVVPAGRLDGAMRATVDSAVGGLAGHRPAPGLLDSVTAAYAAVQRDFQSDMLNQVIVFTDDGNGDTADTAAVNRMVSAISDQRDPAKPIQLSIVVLSAPDSAQRLRAPVKPIEAYVGEAATPDDVQAAFIHVVAGGLHE